jgi:hypothetical protein
VVDTAVKHASKMSGTLEFLSDVIPKIIDSPILNALAKRLEIGRRHGKQRRDQPRRARRSSGRPEQPRRNCYGSSSRSRRMLNYLESDNTGGEFAEWLHCGFPDRLEELQQQGSAVIVATYQASPLWPRLIPREIQFRQFVDEFCAWNPAQTSDDAPRWSGHRDPGERRPRKEPIDFDAMLNEELAGAAIA